MKTKEIDDAIERTKRAVERIEKLMRDLEPMVAEAEKQDKWNFDKSKEELEKIRKENNERVLKQYGVKK